MPVDRCVCSDVTFVRMLLLIAAHGGGEHMLRERYNCGRSCGLCVPYIRGMLQTGRTSFEVGEANLPLAPHADAISPDDGSIMPGS